MSTTLASIAVAPLMSDPTHNSKPHMVVLQPTGHLNQTTSHSFQKSLEEALETVSEVVIVDLLWVESTDAHGVAALVAGIQRATSLGKTLSFQSMDSRTRSAVEREWNRHREILLGPWKNLFKRDLEQFLEQARR